MQSLDLDFVEKHGFDEKYIFICVKVAFLTNMLLNPELLRPLANFSISSLLSKNLLPAFGVTLLKNKSRF